MQRITLTAAFLSEQTFHSCSKSPFDFAHSSLSEECLHYQKHANSNAGHMATVPAAVHSFFVCQYGVGKRGSNAFGFVQRSEFIS